MSTKKTYRIHTFYQFPMRLVKSKCYTICTSNLIQLVAASTDFFYSYNTVASIKKARLKFSRAFVLVQAITAGRYSQSAYNSGWVCNRHLCCRLPKSGCQMEQ